MHQGQTREKRRTNKVCKKHVNYRRDKFKIFSRWLKKVIRNFGGWKSKCFWEKVTFWKFSTESELFLGNNGKSETGEKCTFFASEGMDALAPVPALYCLCSELSLYRIIALHAELAQCMAIESSLSLNCFALIVVAELSNSESSAHLYISLMCVIWKPNAEIRLYDILQVNSAVVSRLHLGCELEKRKRRIIKKWEERVGRMRRRKVGGSSYGRLTLLLLTA